MVRGGQGRFLAVILLLVPLGVLFLSRGVNNDRRFMAGTEWPAYGNDPGGMRYSPLTEINTENVSQLRLAWSYDMAQAYESPSTAPLELPEGAGRAAFERMCFSCHTVETVTGARHSKEGWAKIVENMVAYGAQGTPAEIEAVVDYLTRNYSVEDDSSAGDGRDESGERLRVPGLRSAEVTPLVADGVMYLTTPFNRAVALEPETGREVWKYEISEDLGRPAIRGLAYWPGDGDAPPTLFFGTTNGFLVALNAKTGKCAAGFAQNGVLDLKGGMTEKFPGAMYALTSPPTIYKHLVITGSRVQESPSLGPPGDVRAWDARTGELVWRFHTIPRPGEPGNDTWDGESWRDRSGANVWSIISIDKDRGIVFLPIGSPVYDFYGADRGGKNLFGNSLVALEAETGKLLWHYQMVHHDIWDYDLPAQPVLVDVRRNGRKIPAVAQVTKMGFVFLLDRLTGEPLFEVEERPVPQSQVPGEATWPTQPFPLKPPPLSPQEAVTAADLAGFTPEHRRECEELFEAAAIKGGVYTPAGLQLTLTFPGTLGGANWSGASFDPSTGLLYVNVSELGRIARMEPRETEAGVTYHRTSPWGAYARFWDSNRWPCQKPPWGTLNAVDLNSGEIAWKVPLGVVDRLVEKGIPPTGTPNLGGSIVTAGGLVFIGGSNDRRFRAFDSASGQELWVTELPASAHATPLTYLGKAGRQYVVVAAAGGGHFSPDQIGHTVVAFALADKEGSDLTRRRN